MTSSAKIVEIFQSIQGEGLWLGREQIFIRFKGCRLHCTYCDTPLTHLHVQEARVEKIPYSKQWSKQPLTFTEEELNNTLNHYSVTSLSLTGGEPLEQADFLASWLQKYKKNYSVLLETNGVEIEGLKKVIPWIDIISMDVKLPSSSKEPEYWKEHREFLKIAQQTEVYIKCVYDETITEAEIQEIHGLAEDFPKVTIIMQPVHPLQKRNMPRCFEIFKNLSAQFPNQMRLIPQVHKILQIS